MPWTGRSRTSWTSKYSSRHFNHGTLFKTFNLQQEHALLRLDCSGSLPLQPDDGQFSELFRRFALFPLRAPDHHSAGLQEQWRGTKPKPSFRSYWQYWGRLWGTGNSTWVVYLISCHKTIIGNELLCWLLIILTSLKCNVFLRHALKCWTLKFKVCWVFTVLSYLLKQHLIPTKCLLNPR